MQKKKLGFLLLAKRKCGKVSAMAWDDKEWEQDAKIASIDEWLRRGDTVEGLERFEGDEMPEWCCGPVCEECHKKGVVSFTS
jgi:hypothetical protein